MAAIFERRLTDLKEWPDKNLIYELTEYAQREALSPDAAEIVDILFARILNVSAALNWVYWISS